MEIIRPDVAANVPRYHWQSLLALGDRDDPVDGRIRAVQLAHLIRFLPFTLVTLGLHSAALAMSLASSPLGPLAVLWFVLHGALLWGIAGAAARIRQQGMPTEVSRTDIHGVAAAAATLAILWNVIMFAAMSVATPGQTVVIASMQLALIGAGAFFFGAVPLAAIVYVGIFVASHAAMAAVAVVQGFSGPFVLVLISAIGASIFRGVLLHAQSVARHVRAGEELREQRETVAMLLNEYEQNSSDWLFETDAEGRLTRVTPRLVEVAGMPADALIGAPIGATPGLSIEDLAKLKAALAQPQPFRDLVIAVNIDLERRWWSFSASPRRDTLGHHVGWRGVGTDVTEQYRARAQVERMASSDGLTGLANRAVLRGHVQAALDGARRDGGVCAMLLLDLDRFKLVNDGLGHLVGDELLRAVAQRLRSVIGDAAAVARLGGDEFALVVANADPTATHAMAERLIASVSEPYSIRNAQLSVGASIGIAFGPHDGASIDDLMRAADLALYRAKDDGRGVVRSYEPALHTRAEERRELETALRNALRDDQLHLLFQPIYDLANGEVRGFEALLRWQHPTLGAISPVRFIPIAEDIGVIDGIGEWVIRTACAWASRWPDHIGIAVNLSPSQLVNPGLPGVVLHSLAAHGIAPDRLELEITENVFLNETEATRGALAQLSSLGVRIGLDDFGTGYSSLGYLRSSVFNTIKIDRSFVREAVDGSSQSAEIVRHIVSLAQHLGMDTVAEGAETKAEMDAVRALGCGSVQGFYCGRPMAPEDATALVMPRALASRAA